MYLGYKKIYDFQHPKKFFDDFNQNLILRILDGRIQIIHDNKGMEYYPSKENFIRNSNDHCDSEGIKVPLRHNFEFLNMKGCSFL